MLPVLGDELGQAQLLIGAVVAAGHGGHVAQGHGGLPQGVADFLAEPHEVGDGQADDGVQGDQDEEGDKGPQTAAGGVDPLLLVELGQLLLIFLLIFCVLPLQLLLPVVEPAHADHAALGLHLERQHHQLHHQAEEDDGYAVGAGEGVQPADQRREGYGNDVAEGRKHCLFPPVDSVVAGRRGGPGPGHGTGS